MRKINNWTGLDFGKNAKSCKNWNQIRKQCLKKFFRIRTSWCFFFSYHGWYSYDLRLRLPLFMWTRLYSPFIKAAIRFFLYLQGLRCFYCSTISAHHLICDNLVPLKLRWRQNDSETHHKFAELKSTQFK